MVFLESQISHRIQLNLCKVPTTTEITGGTAVSLRYFRVLIEMHRFAHLCTTCPNLSSVSSLSHVWLCDPMDCGTPGFPVHHQLPELTQTRVHWVSDAIQPSHPVVPFSSCLQSFPSIRVFFQWVSSSHQVAKVLEFHKYTIKGETDHQPRLDAWDKCSELVHWEDPEGWDGEGGERGDREGEHM